MWGMKAVLNFAKNNQTNLKKGFGDRPMVYKVYMAHDEATKLKQWLLDNEHPYKWDIEDPEFRIGDMKIIEVV